MRARLPAPDPSLGDTESRLETCTRALLGPARQAAFAWQRPMRDMGLDSLDLLQFRSLLEQAFNVALSPTFFFAHPTLRDVANYLEAKRAETWIMARGSNHA